MIVSHGGKIGDLVFGLLPLLSVEGNHGIVLSKSREFGDDAISAITPLLDAQPRLSVVSDGVEFDYDAWRSKPMPIISAHAEALSCYVGSKIEYDVNSPWLSVDTSEPAHTAHIYRIES